MVHNACRWSIFVGFLATMILAKTRVPPALRKAYKPLKSISTMHASELTAMLISFLTYLLVVYEAV